MKLENFIKWSKYFCVIMVYALNFRVLKTTKFLFSLMGDFNRTVSDIIIYLESKFQTYIKELRTPLVSLEWERTYQLLVQGLDRTAPNCLTTGYGATPV